MGRQIVPQPDGKFMIFSTFTDTVVFWDATAEEVIEWFERDAAQEARREITQRIELLVEKGPRHVYAQFAMTFQQALKDDKSHGGEAWAWFNPKIAKGERDAQVLAQRGEVASPPEQR